jgi:hypothetical protein
MNPDLKQVFHQTVSELVSVALVNVCRLLLSVIESD